MITTSVTSTAIGVATSHAGEILQGAIRDGLRTRRLLLSLPAPSLWSHATVVETPGRPFTVKPTWAYKSRLAAERLFVRLDRALPDLSVELSTNIPVGKGCGSSTADILATVRALLRYTAAYMDEESVARLIVDVEEASDSTVLSRPALFRHREGVVEEYLPGAFPDLRVVVIDAEPQRRINTVTLERAAYTPRQLAQFEALVGELRLSFLESDARRLGRVATASARISQGFLLKPHLETLIALVGQVGGYGVAVSHSGTVVSVLLPADGDVEREVRVAVAARQLQMEIMTQYSLQAPGRRAAA
jgi:uncharacterized protein involved in propanediol utilization